MTLEQLLGADGSMPGCAGGTWLYQRRGPWRTGGVVPLGSVHINFDQAPAPGVARHLLDDAFAAGRLYERRRQ